MLSLNDEQKTEALLYLKILSGYYQVIDFEDMEQHIHKTSIFNTSFKETALNLRKIFKGVCNQTTYREDIKPKLDVIKKHFITKNNAHLGSFVAVKALEKYFENN